jgi:hypothetical protein
MSPVTFFLLFSLFIARINFHHRVKITSLPKEKPRVPGEAPRGLRAPEFLFDSDMSYYK